MNTAKNRSREGRETELLEALAKNSQRRRFLYNHGTEKDLPEYERLEAEAVRMTEEINQLRGVKTYSIKTMTRGTIRHR